MVLAAALFAAFHLLGWGTLPAAKGDEIPQEPSLETAFEVELHPSLGGVFWFQTEAGPVAFAHPEIPGGPAPECSNIRVEAGLAYVLVAGEPPYRHVFLTAPTGVLIPPSGLWVALVQKTFAGEK